MTVVLAPLRRPRKDRFRREGATGDAAARGARALRLLGHLVGIRRGEVDRLIDPVSGAEVAIEPPPPVGPAWVAAEYAGLVAAARLLRRDASPVTSVEVAAALVEGMVGGPHAELIRCADGWVVARFRAPDERELLDRRLGGLVVRAPRHAVWRVAAECRLLVAPVLRPGRTARPRPVALPPTRAASGRAAGIIDWTSLWAGPWASGGLAADGDEVVRIEAPTRPDGFLLTKAGRVVWERFNGGKRLVRADARDAAGRTRIAAHLASSDLLLDDNTRRVLPQLGFDETWLRKHAPRLSVIALSAYDGEHAGLCPGSVRWPPPSRACSGATPAGRSSHCHGRIPSRARSSASSLRPGAAAARRVACARESAPARPPPALRCRSRLGTSVGNLTRRGGDKRQCSTWCVPFGASLRFPASLSMTPTLPTPGRQCWALRTAESRVP